MTYGVSVARHGFPAARRRDRNRSAWRFARPNALCVAPPRAYLAHAAPGLMAPSRSLGPTPHLPWAAAISRRPSTAATWPYPYLTQTFAYHLSTPSDINYELCMTDKTPQYLLTFAKKFDKSFKF